MPVLATPYRGDRVPTLGLRPAPGAGDPPAKRLLPSQLGELADAHHAALIAERPPLTYLETLMTREVARHAAALDLAADSECSVLRLAESHAAAFGGIADGGPDALRVAVMNNDVVQRLTRYRAAHERGLYAAMRQLTCGAAAASSLIPTNLFKNEEACIQRLFFWHNTQGWNCPSCRANKRCWLKSRTKFECACGKQFSVRFGTVYYQSHVPLMAWFTVVARLIVRPSITAGSLAAELNMARKTTIAGMIKKVSAALESPNADRLLADVDAFVLEYLHQARRNTGG